MATHTITSTDAQDVALKELGLKLSDATQCATGQIQVRTVFAGRVSVYTIQDDGSFVIDYVDTNSAWIRFEEDSE
jgi:ribosomal protein L27